MIIPNPKVYQAARDFAQGAPSDNIKELLLSCIDFDKEDVERLLLDADKYRNDIDGGYNAFINIVNLILKTDAYSMKKISRRNWRKQSTNR